MTEPDDTCRPVTLPDGTTVRVHGEKPMDERDAAALADVITAVQHMAAELPPRSQRAEEFAARMRAKHPDIIGGSA
jgi:hypothetical protein